MGKGKNVCVGGRGDVEVAHSIVMPENVQNEPEIAASRTTYTTL